MCVFVPSFFLFTELCAASSRLVYECVTHVDDSYDAINSVRDNVGDAPLWIDVNPNTWAHRHAAAAANLERTLLDRNVAWAVTGNLCDTRLVKGTKFAEMRNLSKRPRPSAWESPHVASTRANCFRFRHVPVVKALGYDICCFPPGVTAHSEQRGLSFAKLVLRCVTTVRVGCSSDSPRAYHKRGFDFKQTLPERYHDGLLLQYRSTQLHHISAVTSHCFTYSILPQD